MISYYTFLISAFAFISCDGLSHVVVLSSDISSKNPTTLTCPVENEIQWTYVNASDVSVPITATTTSFNLTSLHHVGNYLCKSNGSVAAEFLVAYVAAPTIQNTRESVTFSDGDVNKKLTCSSVGSYPVVEFVWKYMAEHNDAYERISTDNDTNINITDYEDSSVIFFRNLSYDLQGRYECSVHNIAGNRSVEVLIRVKDRLAALWPFLGIVGEVTLLIAIIFLYEKKSKKGSQVVVDDVGNDANKPLNIEQENESDSKVRNRVANNNHK